MNSGDWFIRLDQGAGLGLQHDGNAIPNRKREAIDSATQFRLLAIIFERTFAQRANENIKQSGVHKGAPQ